MKLIAYLIISGISLVWFYNMLYKEAYKKDKIGTGFIILVVSLTPYVNFAITAFTMIMEWMERREK